MLLPLRTDSPLRNTPYMNWALIAANVLIFGFTGLSAQDPSAHNVVNHLSLSPRQPLLYQYITYQFLHSGWMHLAGNMLFLYIFGNNVNDRIGNLGYLAFYLAGGICSGLAYVVTQKHDIPMVGASGAISAVTGAYLVLLPRSNVTIVYFYYFIGTYDVPSLWFILFFFAYDVVLNIAGADQVAHIAHIGGTVYGVMICSGLLVLRLLPRDHFDFVSLVQRWNRRRQYRDVVSSGYNPFEYTQAKSTGDRPAPAVALADPTMQRVMEIRAQIADSIGVHDVDQAAGKYLELKKLDSTQVLSRQNQIDVANHLAHQQLYPEAAEAYEIYLRHYPKTEQTDQVELMLGLIYARYLAQYEKARLYLKRVTTKLHGERELSLAREELARLDSLSPSPPTA